MNKTVIWVVVAIIVIGAAAYFLTHKKASAPATTNPYGVQSDSKQAANATPAANPPAASTPQSLKDLVAAGGSQKCTFSDAGSTGTFYVGGGKARGDFSTMVNGKASGGHMVMDGQTSYIWMDGQAQGFKMSATAATANSSAPTPPTGQPQGVDASKKMDYACSSWSADSTSFSLPSGVQFVDIAAMMKK